MCEHGEFSQSQSRICINNVVITVLKNSDCTVKLKLGIIFCRASHNTII